MKYIPALAGILFGIFLFVAGIRNMATREGLETIWRATYLFVGGCIGLATAWILDLIASFERNAKRHNTTKQGAKQGTKKR